MLTFITNTAQHFADGVNFVTCNCCGTGTFMFQLTLDAASQSAISIAQDISQAATTVSRSASQSMTESQFFLWLKNLSIGLQTALASGDTQSAIHSAELLEQVSSATNATFTTGDFDSTPLPSLASAPAEITHFDASMLDRDFSDPLLHPSSAPAGTTHFQPSPPHLLTR